MAKDVIEFVLSLKDEASGDLRKVKGEASGADEAIKGVDESAGSAGVSLATFGKAAATAAAVTVAVGSAMFQAANAASALVDKYVILGIQTGIATQKIVGLDFAAQAAGLNGVQDLQTGLASLMRTANDAADGSKEAADKFAKLGLSPSDLRIDDTDALLRQVADAMGEIDNDSTRAGVAIELFGARGAKLSAVLAGGSAALDEWGAAAEAAGLVIDEKALRASADMDKAVAQMTLSFKALVLNVGEEFVPLMRDAAAVMSSITPIIVKIAGFLAEDFVLGVRFAVAIVEEFAAVVASRFKMIGTVIQAVKSGDIMAMGRALDDLADAVLNPIRAFGDFGSAARAALESTREFDAARDALKGTESAAGAAANKITKIGSEADAAAVKVKSLADVLATTDLSSLGRSTGGGEAFARMGSGDADLSAGPRGSRPLTEAEISGATGSVGALAGGNVAGALRDVAPAIGSAIGAKVAGPIGAAVGEKLASMLGVITAIGASIGDAENQRASLTTQIEDARKARDGAASQEQKDAATEQIAELQKQRAAVEGGAQLMGSKIEHGFESLLAGLLALPELLIVRLPEAILGFVSNIGDILGDAVVSLIDGLTGLLVDLPGIMIRLPFQILAGLGEALGQWWSDIGGFVGIAKAIGQGVADWFEGVWARIKDLFTLGKDRDNDGKSGIRETGGFLKDVGEFIVTGDTSRDHYAKGGFVTRDGLAMVERGERITRPNGESNQSTRAAMSRGNRPPVIIQNTGFMDIDAADRLVDRLERRYGAEGNRSSALFAG